jgi:ppGpp synthetase/RelA/SpoT-type nucleotidyltranferase/Tfp pilus assembly protein PilF
MPIIDDFINQYAKKIEYYREAGRVFAQICEINMEQMGIRAIVTSRAKKVDRLRDKLEKRYLSKNYTSLEEIEEDIADLVGVRIAIYFPGDLNKVQKFIETFFYIKESRIFPGYEPIEEAIGQIYKKRFSGYWATHCRVYLKEKDLTEDTRKYANTLFEIQIASALMHAWAEVEHDLVYKPYSGDLSYEEYQILDELNGLVLAGEIALQRLQKAVKNRVSQAGKEFNDHYEVAMFLHNNLGSLSEEKQSEIVLGRVDLMFQCIKSTAFQKPEKLKDLLAYVDTEDRERSIVEQIMEQIQILNPEIYEGYRNIKQSEELKYQLETLKINRESGNRQGEANTLANIGYIYSSKERYDEAIHYFTKALQINVDIGGRQGEANQLLNLGSSYRWLGDMTKALEYCNQALKLHTKIYYKQGQANTLSMIGNIYADRDNYEQAARYYMEALGIYRMTKYKIGEMLQLNNLGALCLKQKDRIQAMLYFNQTLDLCRDYEYKQGEADALYQLGKLMHSTSSLEEAVAYYKKALEVQEDSGNQRGKINILVGLGDAYQILGKVDKAYEHFQEALTISRSMETKNREAELMEKIKFLQSTVK